MIDLSLLVSDLQRDEGWRGNLYDDANGALIKPGSLVKGHATIGYGFALDVSPLTQAEALPILTSRAMSATQALLAAAPWIDGLPEPCQRALSNMAYNLGVAGLLKFTTFMDLMKQGKFDQAADDLATTAWFQQVKSRGPRIQALIRQGAS